jgi:hypothetical protein
MGNIIDNVSIDISNNFSVVYGFNVEAQNAKPGKLGVSLKITTKYLDDDQLTQLMGSATAITSQTPVDIKVKFAKGTDKYVEFVFKDVVLNRVSDTHNLNEFVVEEIDVMPRRIEVNEVV